MSNSLFGPKVKKVCPKVFYGLICAFLFMSNASSFGERTSRTLHRGLPRGQDERTCCRCCQGGSHPRAYRSKELREEGRSARADEDMGHPLPWPETWCQTPGRKRSRPRRSTTAGRKMRALILRHPTWRKSGGPPPPPTCGPRKSKKASSPPLARRVVLVEDPAPNHPRRPRGRQS